MALSCSLLHYIAAQWQILQLPTLHRQLHRQGHWDFLPSLQVCQLLCLCHSDQNNMFKKATRNLEKYVVTLKGLSTTSTSPFLSHLKVEWAECPDMMVNSKSSDPGHPVTATQASVSPSKCPMKLHSSDRDNLASSLM